LRQKTQHFSIFVSIQNTHFPESGKRFQVSGMCAIDSCITLTLIGSFLKKIFESKKHEKIAQTPVFYTPYILQSMFKKEREVHNAISKIETKIGCLIMLKIQC
jgi:hypothetical protein